MSRTDSLQLLMLSTLVGAALWAHRQGYLEALRRELRKPFVVYSAQTIRNAEAEFIRDALPKRFRFWALAAAAIIAVAIAVLWLML